MISKFFTRFIPNFSNERREQSSTEAPFEEEYEYIYEDEPIESERQYHPDKDVETKVSVSISASQQTSTPSPKVAKPQSGVVISVATTKSVSSRLLPTPPTTPTTFPTTPEPTPLNFSFQRATGSSIVSNPSLKTGNQLKTEEPTEFDETYPILPNASTTTLPQITNSVKLPTSFELENRRIVKKIPSSTTQAPTDGIKFEDVSPFLPPDYKKPPPIKSLLPKLLFKEVSQDFLPKDYVMSTTTTTTTTTATTTSSTTTTTPSTTTTTSTTATPPSPLPSKNPLEALLSKIRFEEDLSKLLPAGYKETSLLPADYKAPMPQETTSTTVPPSSASSVRTSTSPRPSSSTVAPKFVFPTRAGGFKPTRPPTPEPVRPETPPPLKVAVKSGWPTR